MEDLLVVEGSCLLVVGITVGWCMCWDHHKFVDYQMISVQLVKLKTW